MRTKFLIMLFAALALALAGCNGDDDAADDDDGVDEPALPDNGVDDDDLGDVSEPEPDDDAADDGDDAADDDGDDVAQADPSGGEGLDAIRDRGELNCGVNDAVPGFGFLDEDGQIDGFDVDFCRAIAVAILGDAEAVNLIPIAVADRFTSLQAGEIDVLSRNTTWTASRDGTEGAAFATTTYYDGQGMMVRAGDGFESIDDMENTIVCTLEGTTTELNLATRFTNIAYEPLTFADTDSLQESFVAEACDGWTSDMSQLAARRAVFPEEAGGPDSLLIIDEVFSKEPLGPAVADGNHELFDAVNWAIIATIQAEEFGISQDNIDDFMETDDPDIRRFLGLAEIDEDGQEGAVADPGLGLDTDFNQQIIRQVGSYADLFERHLGTGTELGLSRGVNSIWTEGGLLYAPPYR